MGNNSSKDGASVHSVDQGDGSPKDLQHRKPRPRESLQALSRRSVVDPPSASLAYVQGEPAELGQTHASTQLRNNQVSHGRPRSATSVASPSKSHDADMPASGSLPVRSLVDSRPQSVATAPSAGAVVQASSPAQPVSVPAPSQPTASSSEYAHAAMSPRSGSGPSPANYYLPGQGFQRPPRLPLPIEEEIHAPGSPIISPADVRDAILPGDEEHVDRSRSMLSNTTMDEDEWMEEPDTGSPRSVPTYDTLVEWKQEGNKVYVAGSFHNWGRKIMLHKNGPNNDPNTFSRILQLPAGTHHLIFLVDGIMTTAQHLPTTVDFTTSLVNYIEVGPQYPGTEGTLSDEAVLQSADGDEATKGDGKQGNTSAEKTESAHAQGLRTDRHDFAPQRTEQPEEEMKPERKVLKKPENKAYHQEIPRFLLDLDAPEESSRFQRAGAAMGTQPTPPSLPMFLSRSILNGATPMKDDASVLNMPNHTVLNHLATSSIKNNVLATSATTRYKRKFLTTIIYKPTSDFGD